MVRAVREWQRQVPEVGAGPALNALIPALAAEMNSVGSMATLRVHLALLEAQHRQQATPEGSG